PCVLTSFPTRRSSDLVAQLVRLAVLAIAEFGGDPVGDGRQTRLADQNDHAASHRADSLHRTVQLVTPVVTAIAQDVLEHVDGVRSEEHTSELQSRENL